MALNVNEASSGPQITPMDPGAYPAVLLRVLDLGVQPQRPYQGVEKKPMREVMLTYEFLDEFMLDEDGNEDQDRPRWLSETMALHSINSEKAKSTIRYRALDAEDESGGDLSQLAGTLVTVTVAQNPGSGKNKGRIYENIMGVAKMRAKDVYNAPDPVNDICVLDLDNEDTWETFTTLPMWLKEKIRSHLENKGSPFEAWASELDEDVPAKVDVEEAIDAGNAENPY